MVLMVLMVLLMPLGRSCGNYPAMM